MGEYSHDAQVVEHRFRDKAYWQKVAGEAHRIAWAGYSKKRIADLPLRLRIARTILNLRHEVWTDADIARAMFGGDRADNAASIRFNKFKQGTTNLDEIEASLLACFINYALVDGTRPPRRLILGELLDFSSWMLEGHAEKGPITAADLSSDIFAFTRKLHALATREAAIDGLPPNPVADGEIHDWLMEVLYSPVALASWERRLIVQHPRAHYSRPRQRFGSAQRVGTDPRRWVPVELTVGEPIEYGLATKLPPSSRGWFVTIRDPAPLVAGQRMSDGQWVWNAGWEQVIRWLPSPFPLGEGPEITIPAAGRNDLLDIRGLFRVFLLVEPPDSQSIASVLGVGSDTNVPDEHAYLRLLDNIEQLSSKTGMAVFTGSYLVADPRLTL